MQTLTLEQCREVGGGPAPVVLAGWKLYVAVAGAASSAYAVGSAVGEAAAHTANNAD